MATTRKFWSVTSRLVVEFLDTVRGQCADYAVMSSGLATSSSSVVTRG